MSKPILYLKEANIFQDNTLILKNVDFEIQPGEFFYLIGKTGSGKSSLLKILYGDLSLINGVGEVVDYDLPTLKEKQIPFLRRKIGIVFQDFKLLNDRNIQQNLLFVLKATGWKDKVKMNAKIEKVLDKVGLSEKKLKMPYQLSGGEQQRIAIARALLNDPELIIADEPTGNLDPKTSMEVMELLNEIHLSGKTVLMATHDYSLILKYPQRTFKVEDGEVFEVAHQQQVN